MRFFKPFKNVSITWHGRQKPVSSHKPVSEERLANMSEGMRERVLERKRAAQAMPEVFHYPSWATIQIGLGTTIYWRGGLRFDWNSEYIARKFGEEFDAPHGLCYQYQGILGTHHDI